MSSIWTASVGNLATIALVMSGWGYVRGWIAAQPARTQPLIIGLFMGCGAAASMLMSVELQPGSFVDLRSTMLVLAGFFGGPPAAVASLVVALLARLALGGVNIWVGVCSIAMATGVGLIAQLLLRGQPLRPRHLIYLGSAAAIGSFAVILLLAAHLTLPVVITAAALVAVMNLAATYFSGMTILRTLDRSPAGHASIAAPEPPAITAGENGASVAPFSVSSPAGHARDLLQWEQHLTEASRMDKSGSQVASANSIGKIMGLAGNAEQQLGRELLENRNLLAHALSEMSDGLAVFDSAGYLVFSNEQYQHCFPLTGSLRVPGAHIRDILIAVVASGEQLSVPIDAAHWVDEGVAAVQRDSIEEISLCDGRWLYLRSHKTSAGSTMVVVSDVTGLKQAEEDTRSAKEQQLRLLADTDGLTGLFNRRVFDLALKKEVARSIRSTAPLSLLMVDVDRFKAYNDHYGHPAGDECLRIVSRCLADTVKRPADLVARYGGEEFVVILPDTDEDGAYFLAQEFRMALRALAMPNAGSEKGIVTASVGISTYGKADQMRYPDELVSMADDALYGAKAAGRDRVNGWHNHAKINAAEGAA